MAVDLVFPHYVSELYKLRHRSEQKWFYLDRQMPDEVLLIKMCDSGATAANRIAECEFSLRVEAAYTNFGADEVIQVVHMQLSFIQRLILVHVCARALRCGHWFWTASRAVIRMPGGTRGTTIAVSRAVTICSSNRKSFKLSHVAFESAIARGTDCLLSTSSSKLERMICLHLSS